jgi:ubiquitin C
MQHLIFRGNPLEDHCTLRYYDIGPNETIHLVIRLSGMQVFVKTLTGKTIIIETTPQGTVLDVKRQIQGKEAYHPIKASDIQRETT